MPSKDAVLELVHSSKSYEEIGTELEIPPGLAYLVGTGLPADGSDVLAEEDLQRDGILDSSSQALVNPPLVTATHTETVRSWVRARAADDDALRAAAAAHGIEPPPIEGESDDVISMIGWDHNQVQYLEQELKAIPARSKGGDESDHATRVLIAGHIAARLREHESLEQEHFWPEVRRTVPGGDSLADTANDQEQESMELLAEIGHATTDPERFDECCEQLTSALRTHVAFEDSVLLQASEAISEQRREELGRKFKAARAGTTRPSAPGNGSTGERDEVPPAEVDEAIEEREQGATEEGPQP